MISLAWYINLYYKFREYPISEINAVYKPNELRPVYSGMLKKLFTLFQLDNRRQGEIEGIISKNNYDHMLNKKAQSHLEQQQALCASVPIQQNSAYQSKLLVSRHSVSSIDHGQGNVQRDSVASVASGSQQSRFLAQTGPNQKNMDVFYELMIKMIRISFRRLTIETFAFDQYGKNLQKEGMHQTIRNNSDYNELYNNIESNNQGRKDGQQQDLPLEEANFPSSIQALKYEFLKYCITSKVYNSPQSKIQSVSESLVSYDSSQNASKSSSFSQEESKSKKEQQVKQALLVGDNEIETLILKVSEGQTCIFNNLVELYMEEIRKGGNNQIEILGVKNIAQSVFQMAGGKAAFHTATNSLGINRNRFRRGIFDERGEYAKQSEALSNSNLLLATWFDLILFKEKAVTLHEIVQKLVSLGDQNSYLASLGTTDRIENNNKFYLKVSSYFHLLILNTTKNLFAQSLCKINYLLVILQDVLGDYPQQLKRSFKDIRLKNFQCKLNGQNQYFENVKLTYDSKVKKNLWKQEAMQILLAKWKIIANVITQLCVKNSKAFFAYIFQKCADLLDQQLDLQVKLVNQMMEVSDNITLQGQIRQKEGQKCQMIKRGLNNIIREIIGFSSPEKAEEMQEQKYIGINNFSNLKSQNERYRESSFVNREDHAQQLGKWSEIMNQNIFIFRQYCENLTQINKLFKSNHIYIALWFNKFHSESKIILKKLGKPKISRIFYKFLKETPILWDSMNNQKQPKRNRNRLKRCQKSKFRNRISSIKTEGPLSINEKKAIVLNYMVKAQLQLYSHYMQINTLNGQKNIADFFGKETTPKVEHHSHPQIFQHFLIKNLLLFSLEDESENEVKQMFTSTIRKQVRRFTSNFSIEPRSFVEIQNIRTMNNIEKSEVNAEMHNLMKLIANFQKPMNIELDLKDNWKERFGQVQVSFLGQASDYLRYINEINYLYQFWCWTEQSRKEQIRKNKIELLNGAQFKNDLDTLDEYFRQVKNNREFMSELQLMKGDISKLIIEQQLSEMLKRIKIHNKQLYMINQTIIESQNYFKLLASNLIGRDKSSKLKTLLEQVIITYKTNKREKLSVRMFDKAHQTAKIDPIFQKSESKKQQIRFQQTQKSISKEQSVDLSLLGKMIKRVGTFVSNFEFTPQFYKIQAKILRINCMIASFDIQNAIYKNIKSYRVLSKSRIERLAIIGNKFYDKLQLLIENDRGQNQNELAINELTLVRIKNVYEKKLLLFMTTLITLNYDLDNKIKKYSKTRASSRRQFVNIPQQHLKDYKEVLKKYSDILKRFIYCKIKENIKRMEDRQKFEQTNTEADRKENKQFSICGFLEEILELSEKKQDFGEELLLIQLQSTIQRQTNLKFCLEFKRQLQQQGQSLQVYKGEEEKVEYLRKRLSYLLMREIYFNLNYDNDFLDEKSVNSKRNYSIYEERIASFYEEIIKLDYEQYMQKKQQELKKRSIHLKNYEFKYQKQPPICPLEKSVNQLICCLFNQLLIIYTSTAEYKMFTRRHKPALQNQNPHELFNQYCASEYSKVKSAEEGKHNGKKTRKQNKKEEKDSITDIFAQIFENQNNNSMVLGEQNSAEQIQENRVTVFVYSEQKFQNSQAIMVYLKILANYDYNANLNHKNKFTKSQHSLRQEPITQMELQIIKSNQRSLITMLKSDFLQKINFAKCSLIRKNMISNIEKLYISLDVRHKVFESFKDRILNYEMQKTKIYHQYMDYIRGLKLDVYSHMAGEQSLPYIKIIHAVKLYRLQVKKLELQQRVNQQFEKNLQKWNVGIQKNMESYDAWLLDEQNHWKKQQEGYLNEKKNLFQIFHAVSKQMVRQTKLKINKYPEGEKSLLDSANFQFCQELQSSSKNFKTICKKSAVVKKRMLENKQSGLLKTVNSSTFFQKGVATESTKPTRYEKMSLKSKSQVGLKGLFIKYDTSNIAKQYENQESRKEEIGRKTQICSSNVKLQQILKKKEKRYQSAQKFRSNIEKY